MSRVDFDQLIRGVNYDIDRLVNYMRNYRARYEGQKDIIDPLTKALLEIKTAFNSLNSTFEYNEKFGSIMYNVNKLQPDEDDEVKKTRMLEIIKDLETNVDRYFNLVNQVDLEMLGGKRKTRKGRKSRKSRKSRKYRKYRKSRKVRRY